MAKADVIHIVHIRTLRPRKAVIYVFSQQVSNGASIKTLVISFQFSGFSHVCQYCSNWKIILTTLHLKFTVCFYFCDPNVYSVDLHLR